MTIIVTGGAGFIGSNFVFHMLKAHPDYRIVCLDKLTYAGNLSTLEPVMDNPNFRFVKLDICDREGVYKLFEEEKPDIVVNFAAESHVDRSIENPEIFLQTNILGTAVMMDACRKYGIQRYHQVSTDEVYGDLPLDRPDLFFTEETPIHTSSPYSSSKAGADLLVLAYHRTYPGNGFQMLQQLRPVSLPGKADSADDRQCPGRQAAAGLRQGRKCA
jgi:dTDP-glucose 4,6-dehydratase